MKSKSQEPLIREYLYGKYTRPKNYLNELGYRVEFEKQKEIRKIYLEVTDRCNLNCAICYRKSWDEKDMDRDMTDETLEKVYRDMESLEGIQKIVLGGIGEPFYHPRILDVIHRLKEYPLHITTNGTLLTEEIIEALTGTVQEITVSIDGIGEAFCDIRGIGLDGITDGIRALQKRKKENDTAYPKISIQFVASKTNIDQIFNVIDLSSEMGCREVIVSHLIPQSDEKKNDYLYGFHTGQEKKLKRLWHDIMQHAKIKNISVQLPSITLQTERECPFIEDVTTYITAGGDVVPCYRFSHPYEEYVFGRKKRVQKHSFGNIHEKTLLNIFNSKEYRNFRYTIHCNFYPSCMDCDLVDGCEYPMTTEEDCYGVRPTCADCLWARKFVSCP